MSRWIKRFNAAAILGLGVAFGGAALMQSAPAQAQGKEVNVYSSRHYPGDQAVFDAFQKQTGIKVNVVSGDVNGLIERLKREGAKSPADLIVTVDAANLYRLKQDGLLQPVKTAGLEEVVPAPLRDPDGLWYTIATRARVIAYNTDKVKPEDVATYEQLADAKFKGRLLVRSSNHVYNQSLISALISHNGVDKTEAWAKGIVANLARTPQGGDTDQLKAIAAGEGDVAIVNSYYYARAKDGSPEERKMVERIGVVFPNQADRGTHINVSAVGLTKTAPNKDAAVKLMEFMLTPEAQKALVSGTGEFPVRSGVEPMPAVKAFGTFKIDQLNLSKLGEANAEAVKLADRAGWR